MDQTGPMDHPNQLKQVRPKIGPFSMIEYTDGPTVWSDELQNKYDTQMTNAKVAIKKVVVQRWSSNAVAC